MQTDPVSGGTFGPVEIRLMNEADIEAFDHVLRRAHANVFSGHFSTLLSRNLALTPEAWWIAEQQGKLIGGVGATDFGDFAHIGLMAIDPEVQSAGLGRRLLSHAMETLEARGHRTITLFSTDAGLRLYHGLGFAWRGLATEWKLRSRKRMPLTAKVRLASDFARLEAFDRPLFGGRRQALFRALEQEMPGRALECVGDSGECLGFVFAQRSQIGPFAAATPEAAQALLGAALEFDYSAGPHVALADAHPAAETLMVANGFTPVRTSRYMVRGEALTARRDCLYGIAAYSLG